MSIKLTKKYRKNQRQLTIQRSKAQRLEDCLVNIDPVECPVVHHFTNNEQDELNTYCREFHMPKGTVLTGLVYKIEVFWVMVKGRMRMLEGDHSIDVEAPCLLKNSVGTKNALYAYDDCLFYGIVPNPTNTRNLEDAINMFSATPACEVQGMPMNKQQLNYQKRLQHEAA